MIYTGSEEIRNIMLGNEEISAIYAGEDLIYPMTVTAWSVSPSALEFELTGGTGNIRINSLSTWSITSSENWDWLSPSQISGGIPGVSARTTVSITASVNNTGAQRSATLTITDDDNLTVVGTIGVTQYVCNPLVCANNLGNTNNQGRTINSNFYLFDAGLTVIDDCGFDLTGIKSICHRSDGSFYEKTPVVSFGNLYGNPMGCLDTMTEVNLSIPTVEVLHYCFGNDNEQSVSQTLTSVTFTDTDNVRHIGDFCYYNRNLKEVHLGNLSNVTYFESNSFNASNVSLTGFTVDALPNINLNVGWQYCPLTVDSLVNILNALPQTSDSRTITIGTTNKNKLSAAQLQIATDKGWSVN